MIANRGEIAVRIIRTAKKMGIRTVAIFTEIDRNSLHVSLADEAILLSCETLVQSYLDWLQIIGIARERKAEAIHPGYGFLSENAVFADEVRQAGIIFIGPTSEQIRLMGEKNKAIGLARSLEIPVLNSAKGTKSELLSKATKLGFPLVVKAVSGGGGKGMFTVYSENELAVVLDKAERQVREYFGSGELFIEKFVPNARHIEVQLLGDQHGNLIHLYERECSIQRRFQKIVEEAPSAFVNDDLRRELCDAALKIGQKVAYQGLGTIEFMVDEDRNFWFLEMNTRIQVEHPVTEAVTGFDLVEQQLLVAAGNPMQITQSDISLNGHAIEARICAEDVEKDFRPSTGRIEKYMFPENDGQRTDHFMRVQTEISPLYDSLLAKQIAHAQTRWQALEMLSRALKSTLIWGVKTNIPFLLQLLNDSRFSLNKISTSFLADFEFRKEPDLVPLAAAYLFFHFFRKRKKAETIWEHLGFWRQNMAFTIWMDALGFEVSFAQLQDQIQLIHQNEKVNFEKVESNDDRLILKSAKRKYVFYIQDKTCETDIYYQGKVVSLRSNLVPSQVLIEKKQAEESSRFQEKIIADLYGKILSVEVLPGQRVGKGAVLLVLESMKTEFRILCPQNSEIKKVWVEAGEMIKDGQLLVDLVPGQASEGFTLSETLTNRLSIIE